MIDTLNQLNFWLSISALTSISLAAAWIQNIVNTDAELVWTDELEVAGLRA
jgi:hypothetical protein